MIILRTFGCLFAVLFIAASLSAQITTPNVTAKNLLDEVNGLTEDEAVKTAIENNGELSALRSETEAARKLIAQANQRAGLSVNANGIQQIVGLSHSFSVQGTMPLELGGRRRTRVVTAEREAEVKIWSERQKEAMLAAEVRQKYGESFALILNLGLTEELLASLSETYELVKARVKEGKSAPLEQNMVLVELNRVRSMRESAEGNARVSLIELKTLIGLETPGQLRLDGDFDGALVIFAPTATLTTRAILERPDLGLLRSMEDLADARIDSTKSQNKLDAMATLGYQRLRMSESMQFNYLVFGIQFQLPTRNRGRDAIEAAVIDKQAMEKRRAFGELVVRQEVAKALVKYETAVRAREISRSGVVAEAAKNLGVVRQMYDLGAYSLLEYLAEQRRVIELRKQLIESDLEVFLAKVEVDRASNAPELVTK